MKKSVLFLFPFGKNMGVGHLVREAVMGKALRNTGYHTILWTDGAFEDIPLNFQSEAHDGFDEIIRPSGMTDDKLRFPAPESIKELEKIENLAAVIIDDYRAVGSPGRSETLKSLKAFANKRGAKVIMVDGVKGLEFDHADVIWNMELGFDKAAYKPDWQEKILASGLQGALLRASFFKPEPLPGSLPDNPFVVMIGGTDPMNCATPILEGMAGLGYNPVLIAGKSAKPEDSQRMESLKKALDLFPQSAWWSLTGPQMRTLWDKVKFSIIGPGTSPVWEHFYTRCPFIGAITNWSLVANAKILEEMNIPSLHAKNHDELMQAVWGNGKPVTAQFGKADIQKAVKRLESLGYIQNRLPNKPPFNQVDEKGAERIIKAIGLDKGLGDFKARVEPIQKTSESVR